MAVQLTASPSTLKRCRSMAEESHMSNHIDVIRCSSCDCDASLVIQGMYMCSSHGLIVVLEQLETPTSLGMTADA